ncbi:uncharacterized protein LOC143616066 [Bidens hawaiensis]|uniref:uncharacterized protein LOC143578779 n=1 Tax=Bidens hawaiensis TaxID=980011 RepID=UPI00404A17EF
MPSKNHHQPLHNFSLPFLAWGQRITNNHCHRRRHRNSDLNNHRNPNNFKTETDEQNDAVLIDADVATATPANGDIKPWNRKFRNNFKPENDEQNDAVLVDGDGGKISVKVTGDDVATATAVNGDVKPWNLRPRRYVIDAVNGNGVVTEMNESEQRKMKKKRMLWISLSKDEIEEDIYAFTGSKPSRRPKKRSKIAQKQIDNVFPGLYLAGISADSYRA